ncbi:MAG TPA: sulfite oxidase [Gemmataceae bacterium]|jgi:DMSO/TMAO reductase YedYZ molybdopterin-dependent catalytic subunit|nr:sulfite oxidase [Gemmataceae bacterium]
MAPSRRDFVRTALAAPLFAGSLHAQDARPAFPGLIMRAYEPRNLEFPLSELKDAIVPNDQFFVRSHFAVPPMDVKTWKLQIEGAVEKPFELTYDELIKLKSSTLTATIECAGNGRVNLTPPVPGLQWGQGGVGNAEWGGIPLAMLLEKAGVRKDAFEVVLEGTDTGQINSDPKSPGIINFAHSVPIEKAQKDDVLLAYMMNGEALPLSHGYPLRAVIGGWYGMASVKWLKRIVVTDKPFQGFFQSLDYSYFVRRDGLPTLIPVTTIQPKAVMARPGLGEIIPAGKPFRLFGAAWAGEQSVAKVDVSQDGGKTWSAAKLLGDAKPLQWVLWEYVWENPSKGPASLVARATDNRGGTQPATRDADRRTYMINHLVPTPVTVR